MNEGIFTLYTKCVLKFFLDSKGKIKTLKRQLKKWRNFGLAGKGRGTDKQKLMVGVSVSPFGGATKQRKCWSLKYFVAKAFITLKKINKTVVK